ncbi:TIGR02677 family protein [Chromatiales bacterium (ex Bugula neritina AB1)]|nr:TIGR02677 family protein [Chromatiales bacterium (ex Bugula neritina AB1)]
MNDRAPVVAGGSADEARLLFRYLGGEEWREYRAILSVFADTFFSEFSPQEVIEALQSVDVVIDEAVVPDRLESLRGWGNLAVSTSIGNPSSLDDYYRRRHRYLITRAGQEVYDVVEGILHRVDQVGDVQAGRLRDIYRALQHLNSLCDRGLETLPDGQVVDVVRAVFDPHESFSTEITQFFASINQWQSRFDLSDEEITFFAEILVGYVSEQLVEIERIARPIASQLRALSPQLDEIISHARSGLAARVDDAGLADTVSVRHSTGSQRADWDHLMRWFGAGAGVDGRSRLDALTRQALAAVRTLTANVTRLSRVGAGVASRRHDLVKLARFVHAAEHADDVQLLMAGAFGLFPSRHLGMLAEDAEDPVAIQTEWAQAPVARVPVSLRERGERNQRGSVSPVRNRAAERERLRHRRQRERDAETQTANELLAAVDADGRLTEITVSALALRRLRMLLGASSARREPGGQRRSAIDRELQCDVTRTAGEQVIIHCDDGSLTLTDATVHLHPVPGAFDG